MEQPIKIVYYVNQFFGQIGGEEKAGMAPLFKEEAVGPGRELERILSPEAAVVATVIAGDNYMAEDLEKGASEVVDILKDIDFDLLLAGPAFLAGRYGMACGAVCKAVSEKLHKLTATAMHPENPGVEPYKGATFIVPCGNSAANMREAIGKLARLGSKIVSGQKPSLQEGEYIAQGRRVNVFKEKRGAVRAFDMLMAKLQGKPYETELPMPKFDKVPPAPALKDLSKATILLITTGGVVPMGNPENLSSFNAQIWAIADLQGINHLERGSWEAVHGGYDTTFINDDPNRAVPFDAAVEMESKGIIGKLHRKYLYTTGNITSLGNAARFGKEMAEYMKEHSIDAAILTST